MEPDSDATKRHPAPADPDITRKLPGAAGPAAVAGGRVAGQLVFGRYTLAAEVGRGGMGVVWSARDEKLDRPVALKFLPEAVAVDAEALRDLRRETRRCLDLTHPHIVRVYDLLEEGALAAIAMEFVEGESLAARKTAAPSGCLGTEELAPLVTQLCAALDYAHRQAKVVHRDLKPANLLVSHDNRLKVADFGIARSLSETRTRLTGKAGAGISGTLHYMSPQQLMGGKATAADDIYALGVTLYDLLAGKPPFFRGDAHSLMKQIADTAPPPPTQRRLELELKGPPIPRVWEETILACLAKDPAHRPRTAGEVAERLGLAGSKAVAAPPKKSRGPLLAGLAASLLFAVAAVMVWPRRETPPPPPTAKTGEIPKPESRTPPLPAPTPVPNPTLVGPKEANQPVETTVKSAAEKPAPPPALTQQPAELKQPATDPPRPAVAEGRSEPPVVTKEKPPEDEAAKAEAARQLALDKEKQQADEAAKAENARQSATAKEKTPPVTPKSLPSFTILSKGGKPAKGGSFTIPDPALSMIWVAPGSFTRAGNQRGRGRSSAPVSNLAAPNLVTLPQGYWLGQTDVTQAQWMTVMGANPSSIQGATLPVESVSWVDAMGFCEKMTEREQAAGRLPTGYAYTLPTQDQWEFACRARTTGANAGNLETMAWYTNNSGGMTHSVGAKLPNAWGFYDMLGNVWQWCSDQSDTSFGRSNRIFTGGSSWDSEALMSYGAAVGGTIPDHNDGGTGFRLALNAAIVDHSSTLSATTAPAGPGPKLPSFPILAKASKPTQGNSFTMGDLTLGMVWLGSGVFTMGSPPDEVGRLTIETQHKVTLTHGFWMGQTVVTQAQWNSLMGDNPSHFKGDSLPVETVSWDDALEFCQKLTDQERSAGRLPAGYTYTLPTEAQWEYACRAGTTGDSPSDRAFDAMAWYAANSHVTTHPVGTKQKGAKGLFDMHGNVFEWCLDWYANYPDQAVTDPTGPALVPAPSPASRGNAGGTYRINRGGSWITAARDCRAAFRGYDLPANKRSDLGFRLALAPSPGN